MNIILTIITVIGIGLLLFVLLGLLGWGVRLIGCIGSFLGEGITGCIGCLGRFIWVIILIIVALAIIL